MPVLCLCSLFVFWIQALSSLYEEAVSMTGKGRNKLLLAIEQLLQCLRSPDCPSYMAKVLLRALQDVNGEVEAMCLSVSILCSIISSD